MDTTTIISIAGFIYPVALYLLPANIAQKIDFGVRILKELTTTLENARDSNLMFITQTSKVDSIINQQWTYRSVYIICSSQLG